MVPFFSSNLNSDFSVKFGEVFTIQIVQWPESIKLQVFETKLLVSNVIAEVFVPIPEIERTTESSVGTDQYQFTSKKISTFSHSAVGSGMDFCLTLSRVPGRSVGHAEYKVQTCSVLGVFWLFFVRSTNPCYRFTC